ncbi:MAG: response regulator [Phycisphaeraceae bacterium]
MNDHSTHPADTALPPSPVSDSAQGEPDLSQSTILIVDDNAQNVELLQAYLETLPCRILTASDGAQAMKLIEDAVNKTPGSRAPGSGSSPPGSLEGEDTASAPPPLPDLILLDIMMPRMSGFEVCRKLKEDPATRSIPIMMVTALNELGDIERGVESGTDDFLTKPVNKLELITRVRSLLRVRHLKRELDRTLAYIEDLESRGPQGKEQG